MPGFSCASELPCCDISNHHGINEQCSHHGSTKVKLAQPRYALCCGCVKGHPSDLRTWIIVTCISWHSGRAPGRQSAGDTSYGYSKYQASRLPPSSMDVDVLPSLQLPHSILA